MAVTILQAAKLMADETMALNKGVILNMVRVSPVLEVLPFETIPALSVTGVRVTRLPAVGFRAMNSGYNVTEGDVDQVQEFLYPLGADVEIDRLVGLQGPYLKDPKVEQIEMKSKSMALTFSDYFINGDRGVDPLGFEGLKKRIANGPARQKVRGSSTTDSNDVTASLANARKFLDTFEQAMHSAGAGASNAIFCNEGIKWGINRVLRYLGVSGGTMDTFQDAWGRDVPAYKGVPIYDIGLKYDQTTEIIPSNEVADDAGADSTSIYFVPFSNEQGIVGIQAEPLKSWDVGERESKPTNLIRFEWVCGLAGFGSYGAARLYNVRDAASWT